MEKVWFKSYPAGIKHEVEVDSLGSITEVFNNAVEKYRNNPSFTSVRTTQSYGETKQLVDDFCSFLQHHLKVNKGDRIAVVMPNVLQYPVAVFGALQAGMIIVNVNPLYTATELEHQLKDSGATSIIILENFAHTLAKVIDNVPIKNVIIAKIGDLLHSFWGPLMNFMVKFVKKGIPAYQIPNAIFFNQAIKLGKQQAYRKQQIDINDIAFLQYTGGTTGIAKGAILTHRNICANMAQAGEWISIGLEAGKETIVTPLPLYHIFSLTVNLMILTSLGSRNILIANPNDTKTFVSQLKRKEYNISVITCVNTLFNSLNHNAEFAKIDFSNWKISLGGGAAVQKDIAEKWQKITGKPIIEAYGLTEASPGVCVNPINIKKYTGSIGLPLPNTDIQIRDDDGKELAIGEVGELWIKGPQVMQGYWKQPEETAEVLVDGWLATGDVAIVDENGFVKLVDRKKDIVIVSGFNVYPNEIEDVVTTNPGVLECCCIGIPSPKTGEALKLFVVKKDPNLTAKEIIKFCRKSLTGYKVPKIIEFRESLPKTNVGKILRRLIRDEELAKIKAEQK